MPEISVLSPEQRPKYDNTVGDLLERSMSTDSSDWPMFSDSQAKTWDRCEESWFLSYRQGWTSKRPSQAMDVGTLCHEGLDVYYGNECSFEALDTWMRAYIEDNPDELENISRAFFILRIYAEKYAKIADKGYKSVATEVYACSPFVTPKGRNYWLQGYLDLLMQLGFNYEVWDHKTGERSGGKGFRTPLQVSMGPQTALYGALLREQGFKVTHSVINELNTYPYKNMYTIGHDKLFSRTKVARSDKEFDSFITQFGELVDSLLDRYTHPRKSLGEGCARCQFANICLLSNKGIATGPILLQHFQKKDGGRGRKLITTTGEETND